MRTIVNSLADGTAIKLADPAGAFIGWQLEYSGITDAERVSLEQFYLATEGRLNIFTFVDPTANLLAWSDRLTDAVWTADPFLGLTGGVADPMGGSNGWTLSNTGAGPQAIRQTLNAPGGYIYCVSAYVQSAGAGQAALLLGSNQGVVSLGSAWTRVTLSGTGDPTAESIVCGLELPPGTTVNVFGMQAEAQPAASHYKSSTLGGVYQSAYFRDDSLSFTSTDVNHNSVTVNIAYAGTL